MSFEEFQKKLEQSRNYHKYYNRWLDIGYSSEFLESPEANAKRAPNEYVRKAKKEMRRLERDMKETGYTNEDISFSLTIAEIIVDKCKEEAMKESENPNLLFFILFERYLQTAEWEDIAKAFHYETRKSVEDKARDGIEELYRLYCERSKEV